MNKKAFLFLVGLISLAGCVATAPTSVEEARALVSIKNDEFSGLTHIETPLLNSRQGMTDTFPVNVKFRATKKGNDLQLIQLYVTASNIDWGFYHSGIGEDGTNLEFVNVAREIEPTAPGLVSTVGVTEHFAFNISKDYLIKMAAKDFKIKAYGKNNEGVFVVPAALSSAFLEKL